MRAYYALDGGPRSMEKELKREDGRRNKRRDRNGVGTDRYLARSPPLETL